MACSAATAWAERQRTGTPRGSRPSHDASMSALDPARLALQGTHLIEASAGTGKTYTIATLFLRLVVEKALAVDRILVVTFTEAAASELRTRIRHRLRAALNAYDDPERAEDPLLAAFVAQRLDHRDRDRVRVQLALRSFDEAAISTIHGFCQRVLHDRALQTGVPFDAELLADERPLLDEVVRDFFGRELYESDTLFVAHLQRRGVSPGKLLGLARRASSRLDVEIVPSRIEVEARADVAPFFAAYERCQTLWSEHREAIVRMLSEHPGLHANMYPRTSLPQWFGAMDRFLRDDQPPSGLGFEQLDRFAARTLRQYTKKDFRTLTPVHPFFDACEALVDARKPLFADLDLRQLQMRRGLVDYVRKELPRRKRSAGQQSFDDLLQDLHAALRRRKTGKELAAAIRQRYQAALIDEFQDTDPTQYGIFRTIYGKGDAPLYLIGDPKQAIYGFRGADIFAYLAAARDVKATHQHTMDTNWRSDPALLGALECLFSAPRPFFLEQIAFVPVKPRPGATAALWHGNEPLPAFELRCLERRLATVIKGGASISAEWSDQHIPALVAHDIATLLREAPELRTGQHPRPVGAGDIAVLVRTNVQAQAVQAALRKLSIPSVVYGDASVIGTPECGELERVLAAVAEPTHSGLLRAALTTELMGVTADALNALREDDASWSSWVHHFRRWHRIWIERGFIQMFRALLVETETSPRLLSLRDGERRMTNLLHLAELLHQAAVREHLGPAGLLRWLGDERKDATPQAETLKLRLERDDQAVQLITIHRSKGLEFPIVYCPYLWCHDELRNDDEDHLFFHDPADSDRAKLDITIKPDRQVRGNLPHIQQARFEHRAETLRLLYVALTRARHRCVVYWGMFDKAPQSALGYLLFAPLISSAWGWDPQRVPPTIAALDDDAMIAALRERGGNHWHVSKLDPRATTAYRPRRPDPPPLAPRTMPRKLDRWYRTSSFTDMTTSGQASSAVDAREGRDHDQQSPVAESRRPSSAHKDIALADFPRGAKAGNFFHEVLEHLDFAAPAPRRRALLAARMRTYGYDETRWLDRLDVALEAILRAPLGDGGPALADIPSATRHSELPFVFPVASHDLALSVTRRQLAACFDADYGERVARLGFTPLRGFLKGFIDLVFRHEGRWYLADYKSNHLGPHPEDYAPDALRETMAVHHYVLQSHLYLVALLRHLRHRVPGFDYDRDFGGVVYLFLRGMTEPGAGIYVERPPLQRVLALSNLFDHMQGAQ